jgi:hypothetical protein
MLPSDVVIRLPVRIPGLARSVRGPGPTYSPDSNRYPRPRTVSM